MKPVIAMPSLVDQVYETVLDAISSGDLLPGAAVVQERIAEELSVSRQPVVQALTLLRRQGFIEPQDRKGYRVTPLTGKQARRIYAVRGALDRLAARETAKRIQTGALSVAEVDAHLEDVMAKGTALIAGSPPALSTPEGNAVRDLIDADIAFHKTLYVLSGNPMIAETSEVHWRHITRVMGAVLREATQRKPVWDEHHEIVAALLEGNAEKAGTLAERHVEAAAAALTVNLP